MVDQVKPMGFTNLMFTGQKDKNSCPDIQTNQKVDKNQFTTIWSSFPPELRRLFINQML